jgi:type IV pilus assembly protein PilE
LELAGRAEKEYCFSNNMNNVGVSPGGLSRRARRAARGFTLVEVVIVVALIGIMAALAVPWFYRIMQRSQLRSMAFEVQSTLLAARMTAVRRNTAATVTIAVAGPGVDSHVLTTDYAPLPGPTPVPGPTLLLPKRRIDFTTTPPGSVISFKGDGTLLAPPFPTPGIIVVEGPPGAPLTNQITIETSPTGRVRVITPTTWN